MTFFYCKKIRAQKKFGFVPEDLSVEYEPLRILSSEQQENVKTQKFNRVLQAKQAGEIDTVEFRQACNKDELLPMELDIEKDIEVDETDDTSDNVKAKKGVPQDKMSYTTAPEAKS